MNEHKFSDGVCKICNEELTEANFADVCPGLLATQNLNVAQADSLKITQLRNFLNEQFGRAFMMNGVVNMTDTEVELCEHTCKCGKVWSHGLASRCKVPAAFSPCPE